MHAMNQPQARGRPIVRVRGIHRVFANYTAADPSYLASCSEVLAPNPATSSTANMDAPLPGDVKMQIKRLQVGLESA